MKPETSQPSEEDRGRSQPGIKRFLPIVKDVQNVDDRRDRCELCTFWYMKDPKQKQTSCFDRGYAQHDVCASFTAKPPTVKHEFVREFQAYEMPEILYVQDVMAERIKCIKDRLKKQIRKTLRKHQGAVVYYRVPGERKRKHGRVERVTSSMVWLKKSDEPKIRVDYVVEVISPDEYTARKENKINNRADLGRPAKKQPKTAE